MSTTVSRSSLIAMEKDVVRICKNAKAFNAPGSMIHKDANTLQKFAHTRRRELQEKGLAGVSKSQLEEECAAVDELVKVRALRFSETWWRRCLSRTASRCPRS